MRAGGPRTQVRTPHMRAGGLRTQVRTPHMRAGGPYTWANAENILSLA